MAETTQPPVSTPSPGQEALPYDDALLIKVKGKAKRPTKPDDTERNLQVQKLQAEINRYSDRIKEIKEIIESKRNNAKGVGSGSKDARQRLAVLREERGTVLRQKQAIRDELNSCNAKRESIRSEMRAVKEKTRVMDPAELENKIRELEFKLEHETVPEAEEKRIQQTLQQLNTSRPLVRQYAVLDARLKESEAERASIIKRLQDSDAVLTSIQARLDAEQAAIDEIRNKEQDEIVDVPALNVEKKEAYDIMVALRQKIQEIRAAFDEKYTEYIKLDKNYNAWFRHQRRLKAEERQKEREERDAEYQASQAEASGIAHAEPYDAEIFTIDQLLVYLGSFSDKKEESGKAEAKVVEAPSGMKSFKRKDDDFALYGGVTRKAKPAPSRGAGASAAAAAAAPAAEKPAEKKAQKLNHSLETLKTFLTLGIDVPQTTTEIAATVDKVKAKREHFLELRKQAKEAPPPRAANGHSVGASGSKEAEEELLDDHSEEDAELEAEEAAAADARPTDDAEGTAAPAEEAADLEEPASTAEVAEEAAGGADATAEVVDAVAEAVEAGAAGGELAEAGAAKEEAAAEEESTAEDVPAEAAVEEAAAALEEVAAAVEAEVEPEAPAAAPEANGDSPAQEQHDSAPVLKDEVGMKLSVDDGELISVALSVA